MAGYYTATKDIIETLPDGREIQVAVKGNQIPMAEAQRLGLVKGKADAGPTETKVTDPNETKGGARKTTKRSAKK